MRDSTNRLNAIYKILTWALNNSPNACVGHVTDPTVQCSRVLYDLQRSMFVGFVLAVSAQDRIASTMTYLQNYTRHRKEKRFLCVYSNQIKSAIDCDSFNYG